VDNSAAQLFPRTPLLAPQPAPGASLQRNRNTSSNVCTIVSSVDRRWIKPLWVVDNFDEEINGKRYVDKLSTGIVDK
jgi:hypothetical protein